MCFISRFRSCEKKLIGFIQHGALFLCLVAQDACWECEESRDQRFLGLNEIAVYELVIAELIVPFLEEFFVTLIGLGELIVPSFT